MKGDQATLTASTENWETVYALSPANAFVAEMDGRQLCWLPRLARRERPGRQAGFG